VKTSSEHAHKMGNEEEANPIKGKPTMKSKKMAGASSSVKMDSPHGHQLGNDEEEVNTSAPTVATHAHKLGDAEEGANTSTKVVTDEHKPQAGQ